MSKDKKKSSKKVKSQAEAAVEAMANVTGNAKAAQKALKAGKKLAAEAPATEPSEWAVEGEKPEWGAALDAKRAEDQKNGANEKVMRILRKQRVKDAQKGNMDLDWNEPNLTLEINKPKDKPRPVEVVEPVAGQVSAEMTLTPKERKQFEKDMKKAGKLAQAGIDKALNDMQGEPGTGNVATTGEGDAVTQEWPTNGELETGWGTVNMPMRPTEPLAAVTTEDQGGVPTSAEPRTRTDNLLVMLKQAQESADLDSRTQTVVCPRKYVTKNYGVQLVKKYAAEGIFAEATEDTFVPPDRDHPKGMWEVTLKVHPSPNERLSKGGVVESDSKPAEAKLEKGETVITAADAEKLLKKGIKKAKKGKK